MLKTAPAKEKSMVSPPTLTDGGESLREAIDIEIRRFVLENPGNFFPDSQDPYLDEPLVGFAAADDPLFAQYKEIIGEFHLTPQEVLAKACGPEVRAATVISWTLPITKATRETNRREDLWPSRAWAFTRTHGEAVNVALRRHLTAWLENRGYLATAPQLAPFWKEFAETPVGIASSWSERHAAYAAGLGTFSLNDALITPRGIAHRLGSVVTDLSLPPTPRPQIDYRWNCLFHREGTCGLCIERCPVGAISREGHDKVKCREYVYGTIPETVGKIYQVPQNGCGLCQTKVPCEGLVPPGSRRDGKTEESPT
jgi:epoxyqueuosine reductase